MDHEEAESCIALLAELMSACEAAADHPKFEIGSLDSSNACLSPKIFNDRELPDTVLSIKRSSTVFCSHAFNTKVGPQKVSLRLQSHNNSWCYVGAAPADCDQTKGINSVGLGFAQDGTLRFKNAKIQGASSARSYEKLQTLFLTYEPSTGSTDGTIQLSRAHPGANGSAVLATYQGVPDSWRFAVGSSNCAATFELILSPEPGELSGAGASVDVTDNTSYSTNASPDPPSSDKNNKQNPSSGKVEGAAVGIDLGTCFSCVGVWQHDRVVVIADDHGNRQIPSYVAFTEQQRLIGSAACNQAAVNPKNTVWGVSDRSS